MISGCNAIHIDPVHGEFGGANLRQINDPRFAGAVGSGVNPWPFPADRRQIDDLSSALLFEHDFDHFFRA